LHLQLAAKIAAAIPVGNVQYKITVNTFLGAMSSALHLRPFKKSFMAVSRVWSTRLLVTCILGATTFTRAFKSCACAMQQVKTRRQNYISFIFLAVQSNLGKYHVLPRFYFSAQSGFIQFTINQSYLISIILKPCTRII
jgi:hypothetical protein